jgi:cytochrome c biogenesis protein CcdA
MSPLVVASAFGAGLATSIGPCVAPRYLALAAIVADAGGRARWLRVAAFVTGLLLCYGVLALTASLIGTLVAFSQLIYLGLSGAFLCFGLRALAFDKGCLHQHDRNRSGGTALLAGGALGLVVSPCCTPVVATIAGVTSLSGSPLASFSVAIAFAMGHIAPLASLGLGLRWVARIAEDPTLQNASSVIGGGLSLALAGYYGLLA